MGLEIKKSFYKTYNIINFFFLIFTLKFQTRFNIKNVSRLESGNQVESL